MTKTWTQASGNEPSWLSRVKRVDRTADGNPDMPQFDQKDPQDPPPVPSTDPTTPMESGQRQISDDQVTRVDDQREMLERSASSQREETHPTGPSLTGDVPQHEVRALPSPAGLLRLGSRTRRTPEEQAAYQREKMIRDAWCRPERIDVLKKDEERVYKSGRRLVVERGDGDEVEVHELPREASKKSLRELANLQVFSNSITDGSGPSNRQPTSMRKFDLVKLIAPRAAGKQKVPQTQDQTTGMPLPGQGPRSGTSSIQQPNRSEAFGELGPPISTNSDQSHQSKDIWEEGNKLVVENPDGTDAHVESRPKIELKSPRSLPTMAVKSEQLPYKASANPSLPNFTSDENAPDDEHQANDSKSSEKGRSRAKEDGDDEWEEDDVSLDLGEGGPSSSFYDGPADRNRSTASHRHYPSRHVRRSRRKGTAWRPGSPTLPPRQFGHSMSRTAGGSHTVEFADTEKQIPRAGSSRPKKSSRSFSPSRSIRFAEYPDRPSMPSARLHRRSNSTKAYHKNSAGKNKMRLKNFVAPAVESFRRSGLSSASQTPANLEPSQATGYFSGGHSTPADLKSSQSSSYFPGGGHDDTLPPQPSSRTSVVEIDH